MSDDPSKIDPANPPFTGRPDIPDRQPDLPDAPVNVWDLPDAPADSGAE